MSQFLAVSQPQAVSHRLLSGRVCLSGYVSLAGRVSLSDHVSLSGRVPFSSHAISYTSQDIAERMRDI